MDFRGIERTEKKKTCLVKIPYINRKKLTKVIQDQVHPLSIIHTDLWKAYSRLGEEGYIHRTVNHSKFFKDPVTGVHTNCIEAIWML